MVAQGGGTGFWNNLGLYNDVEDNVDKAENIDKDENFDEDENENAKMETCQGWAGGTSGPRQRDLGPMSRVVSLYLGP